jgi:hypothetical protein
LLLKFSDEKKHQTRIHTKEFIAKFTLFPGKGEELQNLGLCSALRAFEQGGISILPHLL